MDRSLLRIVALYLTFFATIFLSFLLLPFPAIPTGIFWTLLLITLLIADLFVTWVTAAKSAAPLIQQLPHQKHTKTTENIKDHTFKIMTLNIAHGRCNGMHQFFHKKTRIHKQLDAIADLITKHNVTIVALQETDGPTFWSNYIDQTAYIAHKAELPWYTHSNHVDGWGIHYGTSLTSTFALSNAVSHTFRPTPPTFTKGFTLATVQVDANHAIDIISLQLDFSRKSIQRSQIDEMISVLQDRQHPLIVTGDFNSDWIAKNSILQKLSNDLHLTPFTPTEEGLITFPTLKKRFDWILISDDLSFDTYDTLTDEVSDHYAVVAEITVKK